MRKAIASLFLLVAASSAGVAQRSKPLSKVDISRVSKSERAQIVRELEKAEDRADREATAKYHEGTGWALKEARLQTTLEEKYHAQVCKRHKITYDQMIAIMSQSIANDPRVK